MNRPPYSVDAYRLPGYWTWWQSVYGDEKSKPITEAMERENSYPRFAVYMTDDDIFRVGDRVSGVKSRPVRRIGILRKNIDFVDAEVTGTMRFDVRRGETLVELDDGSHCIPHYLRDLKKIK